MNSDFKIHKMYFFRRETADLEWIRILSLLEVNICIALKPEEDTEFFGTWMYNDLLYRGGCIWLPQYTDQSIAS